MSVVALLFASFFCFAAEKSSLYEKITAETGVSLKQALKEVESGNVKKLDVYASRRGTSKIEAQFDNEIEALKKCGEDCVALVRELEFQKKFIAETTRKRGLPKQRVYASSLRYYLRIKFEVFRAEFENWDKQCGQLPKGNTPVCQAQLAKVQDLVDLAAAVAEIAAQKATGKALDRAKIAKLRAEILTYE